MARQMCNQIVSVGRLHATDDTDMLSSALLVFDYGHALPGGFPGLESTILSTALLMGA